MARLLQVHWKTTVTQIITSYKQSTQKSISEHSIQVIFAWWDESQFLLRRFIFHIISHQTYPCVVAIPHKGQPYVFGLKDVPLYYPKAKFLLTSTVSSLHLFV